MPDLMIDIETIGQNPGDVIFAIGAVVFDAESGTDLGETFYELINIQNSIALGMTRDRHTEWWWNKKSSEAKAEYTKAWKDHSLNSIFTVLRRFEAYVNRHNPTTVWAKPAKFDLSMLEHAFVTYRKRDAPWSADKHRCLERLARKNRTAQKPPINENKHNALSDAIHQCEQVALIQAHIKAKQAASLEQIKD